MAEERAIESVGGQLIWDTLPDIVKDNLINREQSMIDKEQQLAKDKSEIDFFRRNMFRIDRSTPTLDEMEITTSEKRLEQSREYLELGQRLLAQTEAREITADEARKQLDNKVVEMKRFMNVRRQREYRSRATTTSRKKVERDYQKLVKKGWRALALNMDFVTRPYTVVGETHSVIIPSADEFYDRVMLMQKHILEEKPTQRPEHYCMTSVAIKGLKKFLSRTKLTPVLTPDGDKKLDFYDKLKTLVLEVLNRLSHYEESNTEVVCSEITISYTISQWESIKHWYPNESNIPSTKQFKDFSLFLASNEELDCTQQIVEYLGYTWNPKLKIEDIITDKPVLTYLPTQGDIRYVKCFNDLISGYNEYNTTDCTNVIRIIKWNDHAGLITELKPTKKKARVQTQKILNVIPNDSIEVFVDIESFSKPTDEHMEQVPYLVCWTDNDEVSNAVGPDCVSEFVDKLLDKYHDKGNITLYAWYGSGYDYQHIYKYLKAKCTRDECKLRNNSIIYAEFEFEPLKLTVHLKDPYLFILTSLDKAAKAFGVLNKGSFPHEIVKDWNDLDTVLDHWVHIRKEVDQSVDGKVMLIEAQTYQEIEDNVNMMTVLERALEYCTIDVLACKQIWNKFTTLVQQQLGMTITHNIFTLSQLSMKLMENLLPKHVWLYVPDRKQYDFVKEAIYGGRVVVENGDYNEDIYYADVVSLYPSAMRLQEHGYGKPIAVDSIDWDKHGIYKVTLTHICDSEPIGYMKFVPRRIDGKLTWKWFKEHTGTYHTYDLLIAKEQGYNIKCHSGIEYTSKGYIFNNFINKLYKLKDDHSKCDCPEQPCPIRWIAKIALNGGGYGKFVQKPIDVETYIVRRDIIAGECDKLEENVDGEIYFGGNLIKRPSFQHLDGEEYDKMMFEIESEPYYATQNGISILSASRYRLYNLIKQFPNINIIYSDTDSIFVKASSVDRSLWLSKMGTDLGQLDDTVGNTKHAVISHMLIGGPKMYAYEYHDTYGLPQITMHCKGVPINMLNIDHFKHLLENEDNKLAYKFTIFKKRLVSVNTISIEKVIMKT